MSQTSPKMVAYSRMVMELCKLFPILKSLLSWVPPQSFISNTPPPTSTIRGEAMGSRGFGWGIQPPKMPDSHRFPPNYWGGVGWGHAISIGVVCTTNEAQNHYYQQENWVRYKSHGKKHKIMKKVQSNEKKHKINKKKKLHKIYNI